MCVSRLHLVVETPEQGRVLVEDVDGARHEVALLALDGPPPRPGEWLVVHSGYAIDRAPPEEAAEVRRELRAARDEAT